jgi:hypothetical protein
MVEFIQNSTNKIQKITEEEREFFPKIRTTTAKDI